MEVFRHGQSEIVQIAQAGSLVPVPDLPGPEATDTARYIQAVLNGEFPIPPSIALQVEHILHEIQA